MLSSRVRGYLSKANNEDKWVHQMPLTPLSRLKTISGPNFIGGVCLLFLSVLFITVKNTTSISFTPSSSHFSYRALQVFFIFRFVKIVQFASLLPRTCRLCIEYFDLVDLNYFLYFDTFE